MICPKCQEENQGSGKFCRRCGAAMGRPAWRSPIFFAFAVPVLLVIVSFGIYSERSSPSEEATELQNPAPSAPRPPASLLAPPSDDSVVHVGIAYGTEKRD